MSKLYKLLKKIVFSILFIYAYNILAQSLNIMIPFNIATIGYVSIFGVSGFVSLLIVLIFGFK